MTPSGIEPATFRFVAQYLNHCATAVPHKDMCWSFFEVLNIDMNVRVREFRDRMRNYSFERRALLHGVSLYVYAAPILVLTELRRVADIKLFSKMKPLRHSHHRSMLFPAGHVFIESRFCSRGNRWRTKSSCPYYYVINTHRCHVFPLTKQAAAIRSNRFLLVPTYGL
jgi:hypothetical protein